MIYQSVNQSTFATIITTNDGTYSSSSNHHEYDSTSVAVVVACAVSDASEREMPEEAMIAKWACEDYREDISDWEVDRRDWFKDSRSASKPSVEPRARSPPTRVSPHKNSQIPGRAGADRLPARLFNPLYLDLHETSLDV